MIGPFGMHGPAATLRQRCPQMTQRRCTSIKVIFVVSGVTILLSLTVFHNIVTETLPQVSDAMPLLGTYESASMSTLPLPSISVVIVTCPTNRE